MSVKFENLNIQTIPEEPTLGEKSCVLSSPEKKQNVRVKRQFRLNFFTKKPKKSMQETEALTSDSASMQNK